MSKQRKKRVVYWEGKGPTGPSIQIELTDQFDARGKHRVYGRGDRIGRLVLNMDVWQARNGRLFVRFWSRNDEVDSYSYEVVGLSDTNRPNNPVGEFGEHWIPECLRDEYDNWVLSEMPFHMDGVSP